MCWTTRTQTNTNNVNKTCTLLQTTGGKDEPNIIFLLRKSHRTSQHGTQNVKTHNKTTQKNKKTKKQNKNNNNNNKDEQHGPSKKPG